MGRKAVGGHRSAAEPETTIEDLTGCLSVVVASDMLDLAGAGNDPSLHGESLEMSGKELGSVDTRDTR